ncbi:MAG: asparagine synthase (glutamine-hydrolyzing) [Candidatus Marinimicrobia bacterium]|nr:asparagine synthase (glutamine-hydrolyzing) [Candidatus Neomarinimicrobiota bacterium]
MSAIAGIIDFSTKFIDRGLVEKMCSIMKYRGPDNEGIACFPHAVIGHRRLATHDLSKRGNQPMQLKNGDLSIVHDGMVYNYKEIRKHLSFNGITYLSDTDAETILNAYAIWGHELSSRLRGMWAFAIWDNKNKKIFLSRDRFGEKPLYYYQNGSRLVFASTLAGLKPALPEAIISHDSVASLLSYAYIPTSECIYKNVKKLQPGHNLAFSENGLDLECYWKLDYSKPKLSISFQEALEQVEALTLSAIKEQLSADVSVGTQLSGGVDSGYIAAIAAIYKPGITAITMTNPGYPDKDESFNARLIASRHNINHIEVPIRKECIADLPSLLSRIEPMADSSLIPSSAVAKEAANHVKILFFGEGADSVFGEQQLYELNKSESLFNNTLNPYKLIAPIMKILSKQRLTPLLRLFRLHCSRSELAAGAGLVPYLQAKDAMPVQVKNLIYGPAMNHLVKRPLSGHVIDSIKRGSYNNWWEAMLISNVDGYFANDIMHKVDSAAMHNSIETRGVFLDHRLLDFATLLPLDVLMIEGNYKRLIKTAAEKVNPLGTIHAPKKGFAIPVRDFFLKGWDKTLIELTRDGISAQMGLLEPKGIQKYLLKHGKRENYRLDQQLYSIMVLEIWLRVFHEKTDDPCDLGERLLANTIN